MIIDGFNKVTLLDYPGNIACIIFTRGCNFACSYCQNSSLINCNKSEGLIKEEDVLKYLKSRKNVLEGIVISGGGPTIQKGLKSFIKKVKKIGLKVKLDTNGSNPKILKELIAENLLDYVAMDIKNDLDSYEIVTKCKVNVKLIKESIEILKCSNIDYEFRTTTMKEYHNMERLYNILELINDKKYYIQNFKLSDDVIDKSLHGFSIDELSMLKDKLRSNDNVQIRGL